MFTEHYVLFYLPSFCLFILFTGNLLLPKSEFFSHWHRFPWKYNLCWSVGTMGLTRCFSNKGRTQSFYFQGFPGLLYFSFVFLEMWEWPPAQRNDLGFKFEILAQYECLKRGTAFENTRWNAALFFVDTWCTHQITCERRIVATSPRDPSASTSCKKHFWPLPLSWSYSRHSLSRWGLSAAGSRQVVIWGKLTLSLCRFLLQYLLGWQVRGPLISPEVQCVHLFAWLSETKGIFTTKRFLVLFFSSALYLW